MSTLATVSTAAREMKNTVLDQRTGGALGSGSAPLELLVADFPRFYAVVHRYLLHRLFDAELAEELTAETFYKAAATARRLPGNAAGLRAWLLRVATNLANTHYRKRRLHQLLLGRFAKKTLQTTEPDPKPDTDPRSVRVGGALTALRPKYQAVVVMRFYARLSIREISEVLGCRQDAVRARLSRAINEMRERLGIQ